MKKLVCMILCLTLVLSVTICEAKNGDTVGYTKYTDIVTYINHYAIQSYSVNGSMCVGVDDLANYGFKIIWNGQRRTLNIIRSDSNRIDPYVPYAPNPYVVGENYLPIIESDIITYANGHYVKSYNVNGTTVVDFESLGVFGNVTWSPELRALKLWVEDGLSMRYEMQPLKEITYNYFKDPQAFFSVIKAHLGLLGNDSVTFRVSKPYSWSADNKTLVYVEVYLNGKKHIRLECDPYTGEIVTKNTAGYSARESAILVTEYYMNNCAYNRYPNAVLCDCETKDSFFIYVHYYAAGEENEYLYPVVWYKINKTTGDIAYYGGSPYYEETDMWEAMYYGGWMQPQYSDTEIQEISNEKLNKLKLSVAEKLGFDKSYKISTKHELYYDYGFQCYVLSIWYYDANTLDVILMATVDPESGKVLHCNYYK